MSRGTPRRAPGVSTTRADRLRRPARPSPSLRRVNCLELGWSGFLAWLCLIQILLELHERLARLHRLADERRVVQRVSHGPEQGVTGLGRPAPAGGSLTSLEVRDRPLLVVRQD